MKRFVPICMLLSVSACDTFRGLDSVSEPEPWDTSTPGPDLGDMDAIPADASNNRTDTGDSDVGEPSPDMNDGDAGGDTGSDVGVDMGVPTGCPRNFAFAPPWAGATVSLPKAEVIESGVFNEVAIAASDDGAGGAKFAFVFRDEDAGATTGRFYTFDSDAVASGQSLTISHAAMEPWRDITVAAGADPGEFAFGALGENPGCVGFGQLLFRGTIDTTAGPTISDVFSEDGACDAYRPHIALTGPDGTSPNLLVTLTTANDALAFPGPFTSPMVSSLSSRLAASSKDIVTLPSSNQRWHAWIPNRPGEGTTVVELDIDGTLIAEWLYDDCYMAGGPRQQLVRMAALDCAGPCGVSEQNDISPAEYTSQIDIARLPGGGYVVVLARGAGVQRLVAYFFDDAAQPVQMNGLDSVELANVGKVIDDFSIAAAADGNSVVIVAVYTSSVIVGQQVSDDVRVATMRLNGVQF